MDVREALEWYALQTKNCRKITPEGETARVALDADGGRRAREALTTLNQPQEPYFFWGIQPVPGVYGENQGKENL